MDCRTECKADFSHPFDVLVIGGGNAALCAAITAREAGVRVVLLEGAPKDFRGGNSRHTRNLRYLHETGNTHLTGPCLEDEFWEDLMCITGGKTNEPLARLIIRQSANVAEWMKRHGCTFQPSMRGTLHLARTNGFFLGGGKALMNAYYATAHKLGIEILYDAEVQDLEIFDDTFIGGSFVMQGALKKVRAKSVVVATGGFQANIEWLKEYWGDVADNFIIRGTPYNKGRMLRVLLDRGVALSQRADGQNAGGPSIHRHGHLLYRPAFPDLPHRPATSGLARDCRHGHAAHSSPRFGSGFSHHDALRQICPRGVPVRGACPKRPRAVPELSP
ncbi:MAG: FAD-dependent oxidoreductase [Desulfobaccales bacterium]